MQAVWRARGYRPAMKRALPTAAEAAAILARRRTRPPRRLPPPASGALAPLLKALHARFGRGVEALIGHWSEIVGASLSSRCEPIRLIKPRGGGPSALEVRVQGPAAVLVQHQAPDILARVNLFMSPETVGSLRIVQGALRRPSAEALRPAARPVRRRSSGPLDAAAEAALATELADFPEGSLKRALARLGREMLRGD